MTAQFSLVRLTTPVRIAVAAVAVLVTVLFGLTIYIATEANRALSERTLSALSIELVTLRRVHDNGGVPALKAAIDERLKVSPGGLYRLTAADGRVLAGNFTPDAALTGAGSIFTYRLISQPMRDSLHAAGLVVPTADNGQLAVAIDIEDQRTLADKLRGIALSTAALLTLLGLGAGWLLSRTLDRRIAAINTAAAGIMAGDFDRRIPLSAAGDEIDGLAHNLNRMLDRIEELMSALREVSDNIAHDLKTPLTRLRNRAEAALRDPAGAPAVRDGLERTIEEADGLIQTFNALLLIARLEAGAVESSKSDADLAEIVADVVDLYQPVADEAGLSIVLDAAGPVRASVNRQLFGQAVANLVDNAIKYSRTGGDGGAISVSVHSAGSGVAEVVVGDHGPGIPEADRGRVLKRFVRLEKSRSMPGTGLGLSLVAAVARLHDGLIRLEDNTPGLRVVMRLGGQERAPQS